MELLDLCDRNGVPTGHVKERTMVHRDGDCHRTVHVWIIREKSDGRIDVLLQKRSRNKDAYPGCYDISSAGHIPAGEDYETAALRELHEELGLEAAKEDLRFIGIHEGYIEDIFWGKTFKDYEISAVYLYEKQIEVSSLALQKSEVEEAVFMDYEKVLEGMQDGSLSNCIYPEEFLLVKKALEPDFSSEGVRVTDNIL
ncbi:MAG: NUDIX domain-containing protein [Lachnospiraceae bacterium]|nr:NUDIX domain-containing protein [Lachnospiraceae bacterium]